MAKSLESRPTIEAESLATEACEPPLGYSRAVHWLAMLLTATVFPLIWVGGLVTTYDAGMAVPDWPGTYGYNMFAYPASTWIFGPFDLLVEHSHRLLGSIAGLLAIGLVICAYLFQPRRSFALWTVLLLLAIVSQGLLGGFRVLLDARTLAMIHGSFGPVVFAMATAAAVASSRWWLRHNGAQPSSGWLSAAERRSAVATDGAAKDGTKIRAALEKVGANDQKIGGNAATLPSNSGPGRGVVTLAAALVVFSFFQLVMGAQLRHVTGNTPPAMFTGFVHLHLTLAVVVLSLAIALAGCTLWSRRLSAFVRWPSGILLLLVSVQIGLGIGTWIVNYALPWQELNALLAAYTIEAKGYVESIIVTAHQATGSLILSVATVAALRTSRSRRAAIRVGGR